MSQYLLAFCVIYICIVVNFSVEILRARCFRFAIVVVVASFPFSAFRCTKTKKGKIENYERKSIEMRLNTQTGIENRSKHQTQIAICSIVRSHTQNKNDFFSHLFLHFFFYLVGTHEKKITNARAQNHSLQSLSTH